MEQSELSFSNPVSKQAADEGMSMYAASFQDAASRLAGPRRPASLSGESIRKGEWLLGTYRVESDPIHGGMGSVYRVHHGEWDLDLAMKRPQPMFFAEGSSERKETFIRECERWIGLGLHPNIVSCYYVREIGGVPTIFSEWMDGGSLKDRIGSGLYDGTPEEVQERILDIALQTVRGLKYAHERGLVHQDVKPGNLLITRDWDVKAADFGLAQAAAELEEKRGAGRLTGYTPQYCPKEQADGEAPARWMDVYAFALTVLEMYAGRRFWASGAEAGADTDALWRESFRAPVPRGMRALITSWLTEKPDGFGDAERALLALYLEVTGRPYPRPVAKAASDTADSLNNRALSFLDLGQPEEACRLWAQALYADPDHCLSRFNRELYRMRSGQEWDYEAMEALDADKACRKADMAGDIFREWDRTGPLLPEPADFQIGARALRVQEAGKDWIFTLGPEDNAVSKGFAIARAPRDGQGDCAVDDLKDARDRGSRILGLAVHPEGEQAAVLLEDRTLCLYGLSERRVLRAAALSEDVLDDILAYSEPVLDFSPSGDILAVSCANGGAGTLLIAFPSLRVIAGRWKRFAGFGENGLPAVRGEDGACAEIDPRGRERAVEPPADPDAEHALLEDPEEDLRFFPMWAGKKWEGRFRIRVEDGAGKTLFTVKSREISRVFADPVRRTVTTVYIGPGGTAWSAEAPYPSVRKNRPAVYKLSEIITARQRREEDERLAALLEAFAAAEGAGDWNAALSAFREARAVPGSSGSETLREMEKRAQRFAERYALKTIRPLPEARPLPATYYGGSGTAYPCPDGRVIVCRSPILKGEENVRVLRADGTTERTVEIPDFVSYLRVKRGRIFAWIGGTLFLAVYDAEGHLLSAPPEGWPPPPHLLNDGRNPVLMDMDSTGEYALFGIMPVNSPAFTAVPGLYEANLKTGETLLLTRDVTPRLDKYSGYGYLDDDTLLVRTGKKITRFEKGTGKALTGFPVRVWDEGYLAVRRSPGRDSFVVYSGSNRGEDDVRIYRKDGKQLYYSKNLRADSGLWLSGERFVCLSGKGRMTILDLETGSVPYEGENRTIRLLTEPDGRETLLMEAADGGQYELEFDYKPKGSPDPAPPAGAALEMPSGGTTAAADGPGGEAAPPAREPDRPAAPAALPAVFAGGPGREGGERGRAETEYPADVVSAHTFAPGPEEKNIAVPAGFRRIGERCFRNCAALRRVEIPEGVTQIGNGAFSGCAELVSVTLPDTLESIGRDAFSGCRKLREARLPASLRRIGSGAFRDCAALKKVRVPGVAEIPHSLFSGCVSLEEALLEGGPEEVDGYAFENCSSLRKLDFPDTVRRIGGDALNGCEALAEVRLPAKLETVESGLFRDREKLRDIVIPDAVRRIGSRAFEGCAALRTVRFPSGLKEIGEDAFLRCVSLKEITLPDGCAGVGKSVFWGCGALETAALPASLDGIPDRMFYGCGALHTLRLPENVTAIGEEAFKNCEKLKAARPGNRLVTIGKGAFSGCKGLEELVLPEGLEDIGHEAFAGCAALPRVDLPASLLMIGINAFSGCAKLREVRLPARIQTVREGAFARCSALEAIRLEDEKGPAGAGRRYRSEDGVLYDGTELHTVPAGRKGVFRVPPGVLSIGANAFCGCAGLEEIILPDSVTLIRGLAFNDCAGLGRMRVPASVREMAESAFNGCNGIRSFDAEEGSPCVRSRDGVLMSADGKTLLNFPPARGGSYTVPKGVDAIAEAFADGTAPLTVTILNGKTRIGWRSFRTDGSLRVVCEKNSPVCRALKEHKVPLAEEDGESPGKGILRRLKDRFFGG